MKISRLNYSKAALELMNWDVQWKRSGSPGDKGKTHSIYTTTREKADKLVSELKKENNDTSSPLKNYEIKVIKLVKMSKSLSKLMK